jgi:Tol biopolymer transport system component
MYDANAQGPLLVPSNSAGNERHPTLSNDGAYLILSTDFTRPGSKGGYDLWNLNLANGTVSQVGAESSSADDLEPVLIWP